MPKASPFLARVLDLLLLLGSVLASGAIEVTTLTDEDDGTTDPGTGNGTSLREAIDYSAPGVLITFAPGLAGGVISLNATFGELTIDKGLAIDASGLPGGIVIDGGSNGDGVADAGETRCFLISDGNPAVDIPVLLKDLTIQNGVTTGLDGGGNILNLEDLTLDNCIVTGGRVIGSISGGGGISGRAGSLTLTNCTVSHNEGVGNGMIGGGILALGDALTLTGCTISHNRVPGSSGIGGGILSDTDLTGPVATLTNCTLHGNLASSFGGGYYNVDGLTRFIHCTITGNESLSGQGGGVANSGDIATRTELAATIVRDNAGGDVDVFGPTNPYLSLGDNLVGAGSGIDGSTFTASGDQTGTATPVLLAPFGDYGGGTLTMPPLPASPAIDAASSSILTADQRGVIRPLDGDLDSTAVADIGAVELGAPLVVDTLTDEDDGPGAGDGMSLRDAIGMADNTRQAIIFESALSGGTISLTLGQLVIDQAMIIDASALVDGIAIDGGSNGDLVADFGETRCFSINDGSFATDKPVLFRCLTIQNGVVEGTSFGGANIESYEQLTLDRCTVAHGRAIGEESPVSGGSAGGIQANDGSLTLNACTISHNIAFGTNASGGGLFTSAGPVDMVNCTIAHNHAVGENTFGGGVYCLTDLPPFGPIATLVNCTLHNNSATYAGGAYYNRQGLSRFIHCTITGNEVPDGMGGGIASEGIIGTVTELNATIVRDNFATDVDFVLGSTNSFTSLGSNLVGTGGAIDGSTFNLPGDVTGTALPLLLAPFGDYGGLTSTQSPLPGSPAIDGAGAGGVDFDQRWVGRPIDGDGDTSAAADIGAVEVGAPILVDTIIDENDGPGGGTGNSLRDAIALADESRQTIIFAPILDGLAIDLALGELVIDQPLVIDASDLSMGITIDGGSDGDLVADPGETRCFRVSDGEAATTRAVVFKNVTVRNGVYEGSHAGANIHNNEDLTLEGCTIAHGRGLEGASGGGIYCFPGNLTLNECVLIDNRASGNGSRGGGIYSFGDDENHVTLNGCAVLHNQADTNGGGINATGGTLTLTGSTVSRNQVVGEGASGGGIWGGFGTNLNMIECTVSHNQAVGGFSRGGGLDSFGNLVITDSTISHNRVLGNFGVGGGIYQAGGLEDRLSLLTNCTIHRNAATYRGGGYDNALGLSRLVHCTITENKAMSGKGAGIASFAEATTRTELTSTIVRDNLSSDVDLHFGSFNSFVSLGGNLVGTGSGIDGSTFVAAGDQTGNAGPVRLAPLGDYGGPTLTRHPLAESPAIDGGGVTPLPVDQRGLPRSVGSPDIGAVEAAPVIVVDNVGDHAGTTTLRNAIDTAIAGGSPKVLRFDRAIFDGEPGDTIGLTIGELMIPDGLLLFIDASNIGGGVTVSGTGGLRIFNVNEGGNLGVHSLTLRDGVGAVFNEGNLTLGHSLLTNNTSSTDGAGILSSGRLIAASTTFEDNVALGAGGGLSVSEPFSHTTLVECLFTDNQAGIGGAIMIFNGVAELENTAITGNAGATGAGMGLQGNATVTLAYCTVTANNSGGILIPGGTPSLILENSIVAGNLGTNLSGSAFFKGNNLLAGDAFLAPLGEYGGPTRSRPPLPGSLAIEGGVLLGSTPPIDQIGSCRPGGPLPDLGAVEAVPFGTLGLVSNDGDTIPDILEGPGTPYPHLDPNGDDSGVDTDGDGSTDAEEIGNMTDLYDPNDRLRILSIDPAAAYVSITNPVFDVVVTTFPGLAYSLENDQTLTPPFTSLGPPVTASDFTTTFQVLLAPNRDHVRARRH